MIVDVSLNIAKRFGALTALSLALLASCASQPRNIVELERAQRAVAEVAATPQAAQLAGKELEEAQDMLARARRAADDRKPLDEVVHLSYLAERRAEIAQSRLLAAQAQREIEQAQGERDRVLLRARERETTQAQALAALRAAEAQQVQSELDRAQQQIAELEAYKTERGMVLTLQDVLFDTGSATLKPGGDRILQRVAEFLAGSEESRVVIEGHADSRGSEAYNTALSQRRAESVRDRLVAMGVNGGRIETVGLGEGYPVANNSTRAGQQQNRRVEIVFSDETGQFAESTRKVSR
ncbi:MAG: OmpA family protein [Steroidobacteraceae bacterium]